MKSSGSGTSSATAPSSVSEAQEDLHARLSKMDALLGELASCHLSLVASLTALQQRQDAQHQEVLKLLQRRQDESNSPRDKSPAELLARNPSSRVGHIRRVRSPSIHLEQEDPRSPHSPRTPFSVNVPISDRSVNLHPDYRSTDIKPLNFALTSQNSNSLNLGHKKGGNDMSVSGWSAVSGVQQHPPIPSLAGSHGAGNPHSLSSSDKSDVTDSTAGSSTTPIYSPLQLKAPNPRAQNASSSSHSGLRLPPGPQKPPEQDTPLSTTETGRDTPPSPLLAYNPTLVSPNSPSKQLSQTAAATATATLPPDAKPLPRWSRNNPNLAQPTPSVARIPQMHRTNSRLSCLSPLANLDAGPISTDVVSLAGEHEESKSSGSAKAPAAPPNPFWVPSTNWNANLVKAPGEIPAPKNLSAPNSPNANDTPLETHLHGNPLGFRRFLSATWASNNRDSNKTDNQECSGLSCGVSQRQQQQLESTSRDLSANSAAEPPSPLEDASPIVAAKHHRQRAANSSRRLSASNTFLSWLINSSKSVKWYNQSFGTDSLIANAADIIYLAFSTAVIFLCIAAVAFHESDPFPSDTIVAEVACSVYTIFFAMIKSRTHQRGSEWVVEDDLRTLRRRYLCSVWSVVDAITIVPIEFIFYQKSSLLFGVCLLRHVFRLPRLLTLHKSTHPLLKSRRWFAVAFILTVAVVLCELFAVLFSWLEDDEHSRDGMSHLDAIYWTVTTMTSVGYGDVVPTSARGKFLTINLQIAGVLIVASVTSLGTRFLTTKDPVKEDLDHRKQQLYSMLQHYKVPWQVQKEVMAVYPAVLTEANEKQFRGIIDSLPTTMRHKLELFQRVSVVTRVPLFADVDDRVAHLELAGALEPVEFAAGEYVFHRGDEGSEMYFIISGTVEVLMIMEGGEYEQVQGVLGAGQWFGEAALTEQTIRSVDVQAAEACEVLVLSRQAFVEVAGRHERLARAVESESRALAAAFYEQRQQALEGTSTQRHLGPIVITAASQLAGSKSKSQGDTQKAQIPENDGDSGEGGSNATFDNIADIKR